MLTNLLRCQDVWAAQVRPQIGDRADMVLVRVRRDDAQQLLAAFDDKGGVGHDHVDPRLVLLLAEGDAAIEDQPLAAVAVEVRFIPISPEPPSGRK